MDEKEIRLTKCFLAVFSELADSEVNNASSSSVASWDSVTTVTLLALVEEEFGINIEVEDASRFDSFQEILSYLTTAEQCNPSL
jgi:acyl carrier protein